MALLWDATAIAQNNITAENYTHATAVVTVTMIGAALIGDTPEFLLCGPEAALFAPMSKLTGQSALSKSCATRNADLLLR